MLQWLKNNKRLLLFLGALIAAVVVYFAVRGEGNSQTPYQTARVEKGRLVATVGATGTVRARQSAALAWQTSGTVEKVNVSVGDRVTAGTVLASLAPASVAQNIILAQADLVNAQKALDDLLASDTARAQAWIALRNAQEAYDQAKDYYDSLFEPYQYTIIRYVTVGRRRVPEMQRIKADRAPDETIEKAKAELDLKEAQLKDAQRAYDRLKDGPNAADLAAAQARVDAAQAVLNMMRIAAPFDGTITEARPLPGDQVTAGAPAFRVDDLSSLLVDVEISEVDINSVAVGQPVTLTFDAILGGEYHGEVTQVAQAGNIVQGVVNFTVTVRITDADERVKPGMTAAVNIVVKELEDVILIPNRAVRLVDGKRVVYVLRNGEAVPLEVRLGSSSETMSVLAGGDVQVGDLIILNPPVTFERNGGPPFMR